MKKKSGYLVAFEGIDGSGKSTLSRLVYNELTALSLPVILTREPGGTDVGKKIRSIVHEHVLTRQAEFLLFAADRAEHITHVIVPALEKGSIVLSDRMADSSRAYQGYGRGIDLNNIDSINRWVMQGVDPDLIVYCKIDAQTAFDRVVQRKQELTVFESEKKIFFDRVIDGFQKIFSQNDRVLVVDATLQPAELCAIVIAELRKRLEQRV